MSTKTNEVSAVIHHGTAAVRAGIATYLSTGAAGPTVKLSYMSGLYVRVGRLLWGRDTGLMKSGAPVELPDRIFYAREDRHVPLVLNDTPDQVIERVQDNLVRAGMVIVERRLVILLVFGSLFFCAGIFAVGALGVAPVKEKIQEWKLEREAERQAETEKLIERARERAREKLQQHE